MSALSVLYIGYDQHSVVRFAVEAACPGRSYACPAGSGLSGLTHKILKLCPEKFSSNGLTITLGMSRLSLHSLAPQDYQDFALWSRKP
jgi:hypothetical protein